MNNNPTDEQMDAEETEFFAAWCRERDAEDFAEEQEEFYCEGDEEAYGEYWSDEA
jgi:hypothetical protein